MSQQQTQGVVHFTDQTFIETVKSGVPMFVDFWAEWCGPCRLLTPTVSELAKEYEGKVTVGKLNIDENPEAAAALNITSIPTVLIIKGGQVVQSLVGVMHKSKYVDALNRAIGAA